VVVTGEVQCWDSRLTTLASLSAEQPPAVDAPLIVSSGRDLHLSVWRPDELGYFDPHLPTMHGDGPVVTIGSAAVYRSVPLFVAVVKDIASKRGEEIVRTHLHTCLRGSALAWYWAELNEDGRTLLRDHPDGVKLWVDGLVGRFEMTKALAKDALSKVSYTIEDVRTGREPWEFVHATLELARLSGCESTYEQVRAVYDRLDLELMRDFPIPVANITITEFILAFQARMPVWSDRFLRSGWCGPCGTGFPIARAPYHNANCFKQAYHARLAAHTGTQADRYRKRHTRA
jgi:hypothetical protein